MSLDDRGGVGSVLVMGLVLVLLGAGLAYYGYGAAQAEERALENAVEIDVEIEATDIELRERDVSNDDDSTRETETVYRPTVSFTYEYEGQEYQSNNIYPGGGTFQEYPDRSTAEAQIDDFQVGSTMTGYVDPDDPGEAFLIKESSGSPQMIMVIGGLFALMGTFLIARIGLS